MQGNIMKTMQFHIPVSIFYHWMNAVQQRENFSSEEATFVLRTLGPASHDILPEEKEKWIEYLANRFKTLGVEKDITYHNTMLGVLLENNIDFNVVDVLAQLKEEGLLPNRATLLACLIQYCKKGEMESAAELLEHMKDTNQSITSNTFKSILLGHFYAGNVDTAKRLFSTAKEMGFEYDAELYKSRIKGSVLTGDLQDAMQLYDESVMKKYTLNDLQICQLVEFALENNQPEFVDYFMSKLTEADDTVYLWSVCASLTNMMRKGHYDTAFKIWASKDYSTVHLYSPIMYANLPTTETVKLLLAVKANGKEELPFTKYIKMCVIRGLHDQCVGLLPYVEAEDGVEFRPHQYLPFIRYYAIAGDLEGLKTKVIPHLPAVAESFGRYLWPSLRDMIGGDVDTYEQILKEHSKLDEGQINGCVVRLLYTMKGISAAAESASKRSYITVLPTTEAKAFEVFLHEESKNKGKAWKDALALKLAIGQSPRNMLKNIVAVHGTTSEGLMEIKDGMLELGITGLHEDFLKELGLRDKLEDQEAKKLIDNKVNIGNYGTYSYEELKMMEKEHGRRLFFILAILGKSHDQKDWQTFGKYANVVKNQKFEIRSRGLAFRLLQYYLYVEDDPQSAYEVLKNNIEHKYEKQSVRDGFVHLTAFRLWKMKKYEECIDLLSMPAADQADYQFSSYKCQEYFTGLEQTLEIGEFACAFMQNVYQNQYYFNHKELLTIYFWGYITSLGDMDLLMKAFELTKPLKRLQDLTGAFVPFIYDRSKSEFLYGKLIKENNQELVLMSFAAAWLEAGEIKKFELLVNSSETRLYRGNLTTLMRRWKRQNRPDLLDLLLEHTQNIRGSFRDEIYFHQFLNMISEKDVDVDACIDFFNRKLGGKMVFWPSKQYLKIYAEFLKKHDRPVVFESALNLTGTEFTAEVKRCLHPSLPDSTQMMEDSEEVPVDKDLLVVPENDSTIGNSHKAT